MAKFAGGGGRGTFRVLARNRLRRPRDRVIGPTLSALSDKRTEKCGEGGNRYLEIGRTTRKPLLSSEKFHHGSDPWLRISTRNRERLAFDDTTFV